jgi:hypothetical protein
MKGVPVERTATTVEYLVGIVRRLLGSEMSRISWSRNYHFLISLFVCLRFL